MSTPIIPFVLLMRLLLAWISGQLASAGLIRQEQVDQDTIRQIY
jgi:hypothetical protein